MILGICPTVDFAFKKTFGDPANSLALISLLNAILELAQPITSVVIENPFNYQDLATDKLSILDLKAKDARGAIFHIEMQVSATPGMGQRLAFYACELYAGQLLQGTPYTQLRPVYSICLLNDTLWRTDPTSHHRFRLADTQTSRILEPSLEIHLLELPKYTVQESDLAGATQVARWVFWLCHAQEYEAARLRALLPQEGFQQATQAIETIALKTEDKTMYDTRIKAERDRQALLAGALETGLEKGREEGLEKGLAKGLEKGREEGLEKGLAKGLAKGFIGRIQLCQSLLKRPETPSAELQAWSLQDLQDLASQLESTLRNR